MKIIIVNNTHWRTADLRRFVRCCAKQEKVQSAHVTFKYRKGDDGWVTGFAWYHSDRSVIKLPRTWVDQIDLAHTIAHEFAHNRNVTHKDMKNDPWYRRVGKWRERYAWANDLPLTRELPKPKVRPSVDDKLAHAQAMAKKWTSEAKRVSTYLKKWQQRVRYYERATLAAAKRKGDQQ
jgi:hypothetical protein